MIFTETKLPGVYLIDLERLEDERGFFARAWCRREFQEHALDPDLVQCNISYNQHSGTLRGMHYQLPPHAETKLVRCIGGALYDVIVDLRSGSPTFLQWIGVELTADNRTMLYVPKGFAHGFLTLAPNTEVFYQMSSYYAPDSTGGVRCNDPLLRIEWPAAVNVISSRDESYPSCDPTWFVEFMHSAIG